MLPTLLARATGLARRGLHSLAEESKSSASTTEGPSVIDPDAQDGLDHLRRFETIGGSAEADAVNAAAAAAAAAAAEAQAARTAGVEAAAAELAAKVDRLRELLDAQQAVDDEGHRLQRAVQRQEEEDSLKMIALLRAQDEAFASELGDAKAAIEEAALARMRLETEEELAKADARYEASQAAHYEALMELKAQAEKAIAEAAGIARAETEASLTAAHQKAMLDLRTEHGEQLAALDNEVTPPNTPSPPPPPVPAAEHPLPSAQVDALSAVLSHDTQCAAATSLLACPLALQAGAFRLNAHALLLQVQADFPRHAPIGLCNALHPRDPRRQAARGVARRRAALARRDGCPGAG